MKVVTWTLLRCCSRTSCGLNASSVAELKQFWKSCGVKFLHNKAEELPPVMTSGAEATFYKCIVFNRTSNTSGHVHCLGSITHKLLAFFSVCQTLQSQSRSAGGGLTKPDGAGGGLTTHVVRAGWYAQSTVKGQDLCFGANLCVCVSVLSGYTAGCKAISPFSQTRHIVCGMLLSRWVWFFPKMKSTS